MKPIIFIIMCGLILYFIIPPYSIIIIGILVYLLTAK